MEGRKLLLGRGDRCLFFSYEAREEGIHSIEVELTAPVTVTVPKRSVTVVVEGKSRFLWVSRATRPPVIDLPDFTIEYVPPAELPRELGGFTGVSGVVLDNVPVSAFDDDSMDALGDFVSFAGGGLVCLGGEGSFSPRIRASQRGITSSFQSGPHTASFRASRRAKANHAASLYSLPGFQARQPTGLAASWTRQRCRRRRGQ